MKTQKKSAYETKKANKTKTSTKQNTTKILSPIKSGYVQHTSPNLPLTILNILIKMKNKGKSDYT